MELPKSYSPAEIEARRYREWMERGLFRARPGVGQPYCITIPPPNITGSLHIGHALNNTVLDLLTRMKRMQGFNALCLPGTDHAGIGTQNVVERELAREGKTRHDLGREGFIERCWEWRKEYGDRIYLQFHRLGCSYDWDRKRFTMDPSYVDAIHEEFLRWWERGLIYRGARVVNWCPRCRSAISDIEVDSEERPGKLYRFRYPLSDGSGFVTIATTRPETMLGDTAVAANPADERYSALFGRTILLPLTSREIPIIADDYAKMEFGTGAVKVTPAHDLDDFECGLRHNLAQIAVIGDDGTMTEAAGPSYAGRDRYDARKRVVEDLEALGLVEKIEDYPVKLPLCDRCKTVLEPLLSEQWFVKMKPLSEPAAEAVRDGRIRIVPERYRRIYLDWMDNIRDWCISRQLWWGHRIPVWWTEDGRNVAARNVDEAAVKLNVGVDDLRQDEDVLDTWFSSALWPHATLGWPEQTEDLAFWYPTDLLSTAQEILYLWVARMIVTGLDFLGEIPFRDVYIHATVLDENGERMSKSKGNGIDPLEMIDKYGADALRFSLLQQAGKNQDIRFSEDRVRLAAAFCNKLWNASRFVLSNLDPPDGQAVTGKVEAPTETPSPLGERAGVRVTPSPGNASAISPTALRLPDRWILSRLNGTIRTFEQAVLAYDMDDAMRALYSFVWDDFCDWYLEAAKLRLRDEGEEGRTVRGVLIEVLDTVLRLAHPAMPFLTEEIWQALVALLPERTRQADRPGFAPEENGPPTILLAPYPAADRNRIDDGSEQEMDQLIEVVRALRNLRAESGIAPSVLLEAAIVPARRTDATSLSSASDLIVHLARLKAVRFMDAPPADGGTWAGSPVSTGEVFVETRGALDPAKERERLEREMASVAKDLEKSRAKLANADFVSRAPAAVVEKERANLEALETAAAKLRSRLGLPP